MYSKKILIWFDPRFCDFFNCAKIDVVLVQVQLKQQSGGMGLVTSIPEPISHDLSEINIISFAFTCFSRKCLQFALPLVAATKKMKLKVYCCT